jgi:hypothetical protein
MEFFPQQPEAGAENMPKENYKNMLNVEHSSW